jgi:hypothetical protein
MPGRYSGVSHDELGKKRQKRQKMSLTHRQYPEIYGVLLPCILAIVIS